MAVVRASRKTGARDRRHRIVLACSTCGSRNYRSSKNPREDGILSLKKFCSHCNQHTVHIEGK